MGPYVRAKNGEFSSKKRVKKSSRCQTLVQERYSTSSLEQSFDSSSLNTDEPQPSIQCLSSFLADHSYTASESDNVHTCSYDDTVTDELFSDVLPNDLISLDHCRFIVELDTIIKQLESCNYCSKKLQLSDSLGARPMGVTGILYIQCTECGNTNKIYLGKIHHTPERKETGVGIFDVNTKLAAGMIHAGIGETQVNNLLSVMNVHCISHKTLKERENEIGLFIDHHARTSEKNYLLEEALGSMSIVEGNDENKGQTTISNGISVSTDTCWQKKGSGRSYNSLSGVASLIGKKTRKVVHHAQRVTNCRTCESAKKRCVTPRVHNCRKNWHGSAKAMEADMVAQMVSDVVICEKINISELAGDDDSTGFEKIKKVLPNLDIEKTSDRNHIKKNINTQLYDLKNTKKHKELTQKVIESIQKNFSYMIDQNQGSESGIENGLHSVVEHLFGNHMFCNSSWCGGVRKQDGSYKHSNLPYGKDLTSKSLKDDLEKIFLGKLKPKAKRLSTLSSSQANESFNSTVASKAPKRLHFSGSSSLGYRVSSAVLQKNEGYEYMSKVNEAAGMSPGNITRERAAKLNKQREQKSRRHKMKEWKTKRVMLKKRRSSFTSAKEMREGKTYETEIGIKEQSDKEEEVPATIDHSFKLDQQSLEAAPLVIFDLETTSLYRTSDITQIAACAEGKSFSSYVLPNKTISTQASAVTGITKEGNQLFYNNQPVNCKSQHEALVDFVTYLSSFSPKPVLVGHNIKRFDCHVLYTNLKSNMMWNEFCSNVHCFVDSLDLFKLVKPGLTSYSQTNLVQVLLGERYAAHNAIDDTAILQKLILTKCNFNEYVEKLAFSCSYPHLCYLQQCNLKTFSDAIICKALSRATALKAARSNLKLCHLKTAVSRNGMVGLKLLLSEKTDQGNVRVTSSMKVIQKIFEFLSDKQN